MAATVSSHGMTNTGHSKVGVRLQKSKLIFEEEKKHLYDMLSLDQG